MNNSNKRQIDPEWWRGFFDGPFGRVQADGLLEEKSSEEADWLQQVLQLPPGATVLDAPSGSGRLSFELARRGLGVTGVDFNASLIEQAQSRASEQGLSAHFAMADIRQLAFRAEFDCAISWWTSYGYFDHADNEAYLQGLARALRPGGRLVFDTQVAETIYTFFQPRHWREWATREAPVRVLEESHFDLDTGRLETQWSFLFPDGERSHRTSIYLPTYRELKANLTAVGFGDFVAYERPSGEPFHLGSPRLCLIATRG